MRTNVDIDDTLMAQAMANKRYRTKRAAIEAGLAVIARQATYDGLRELRGAVEWDGDLDAWRRADGDKGNAAA